MRRPVPAVRAGALAALLVLAPPAAGLAAPRAGLAPVAPRDSLARGTARIVAAPPGYRLPVGAIVFGAAETQACLRCHGMPEFMVLDSTTGAWRRLTVDRAAFAGSAHDGLTCSDCHADVRAYPHAFAGPRPRVSCDADCHAVDARGRVVRHTEAAREVAASAHGRRATGGALACLDCHGGDPHAVARVPADAPPADRLAMCAPCHEDRRRMARSPGGVVAAASYQLGPHARALRAGSRTAATCESCHDAHSVRAASDTASSVSPTRLAGTCGRAGCHRGAGARFATIGTDHLALTVAARPGLGLIDTLFRALGWGLVSLMALVVLLDAQRRFVGAAGPPRDPGEPLVTRLTLPMRLQHLVLVLAFTALVLTGLPLRDPDSAPLAALVRVVGGWGAARAAHRAAGYALVAVALAHLVYALVALVRARFDVRRAWPLLPGWGAARDAWQATLHALRLRRDPPAYGRHQPREQIHYLVVLLGVPMMVLTGMALWMPARLAEHLPPLAVTAAALLHRDEALIALAVVVVWHLYHVHVSPGAQHRFMTWLDGRVTRRYQRREHPREGAPPEGDTTR